MKAGGGFRDSQSGCTEKVPKPISFLFCLKRLFLPEATVFSHSDHTSLICVFCDIFTVHTCYLTLACIVLFVARRLSHKKSQIFYCYRGPLVQSECQGAQGFITRAVITPLQAKNIYEHEC